MIVPTENPSWIAIIRVLSQWQDQKFRLDRPCFSIQIVKMYLVQSVFEKFDVCVEWRM